MIRHFETADGLRLAYSDTDTGTGAPLLCLPGLTRNMEDFDPVEAEFAPRARVIRLDFRGRGASDHADPATYTVPQEALDTVALLDHLGLDRATILGTSRGGLVALWLAATAKDRLAGVIFNDVGPVVSPEGLANIMTYIGRPPPYANHAEAAEGLARVYAASFTDVPPETWAAMARRLYAATPTGLALRYDPRLREAVAPAFDPDAPVPDLWPLFDTLEGLPLGLIHGAASDILSAETAAEMRRRRPDMAFAELSGRGHVPFLDEPDSIAVIDAVLTAS